MLEYISYVLSFGVLFIFLMYIYIRIKYGFWAMQPVFHVYNYMYMVNPPGIIKHSLPEKNKYTNFKDIETIIFSTLTPIQKTRFANLIKYNYLQNKDNIFTPTLEHILPYFIGHNDKSFISFYYKDIHMIETKTNNVITDKKTMGVITSRPVFVKINNDNKNKNASFYAYYVDYLCVDKLHRKKGIAPQLIQTHHYNQRHINTNISISIFKREDDLTGIVPLCVYTTYGFSVEKWTKPHELSSENKLLEINNTNFRYLYDFIRIHSQQFDIAIRPEATNLLELIRTKNIFVYAIMCDEQIVCCYFYRKTCIEIEKGMEVLSLFASICHCDDDIFVQGFKVSFWKIAAENYFGFAALEDVSHNNIIINNIMLKTKAIIESPTAYYFYNFAYPTFSSNKTFILN